MPIYSRLDSPSYDLGWLDLPNDDAVMLLPGGGGSTKSGIKNLVQVAKVSKKGFKFLPGVNTEDNLPCAVSSGRIKDYTVVVACFSKTASLLVLEDCKGGQAKLEKAADFTAILNSGDDSLNCCCVVPSGLIVTGGDDGVCRVWTALPSEKGSWSMSLESELQGHTGPVMAISYHPIDQLICTGSKDGTCRVWSLASMRMIGEIACTDTAKPGKPVLGRPVGAKLECRGCCFSRDGGSLFYMQSARKGYTQIVKARLEPVELVPADEGGSAPTKKMLDILPAKTAVACKVPCTRLRINASGSLLAVGASDGSVTVLKADDLNVVRVFPVHDLPVTGLAFAPEDVAMEVGSTADMVTCCSADYTAAAIPIGGYSFCFKFTFGLLSITILLILLLLTLMVFFDDYALQIINTYFK